MGWISQGPGTMEEPLSSSTQKKKKPNKIRKKVLNSAEGDGK